MDTAAWAEHVVRDKPPLQDRSSAALCRGFAVANLVRGAFLWIADMWFRSAYISVAVSRSTDRRRIVETSEPDRHLSSRAEGGVAAAVSASTPAPSTAHLLIEDQTVPGQSRPKSNPSHVLRPLDKPFRISAVEGCGRIEGDGAPAVGDGGGEADGRCGVATGSTADSRRPGVLVAVAVCVKTSTGVGALVPPIVVTVTAYPRRSRLLVDTRGNNTDVVSWRDATSSTETASR